MRTQFLLIVIGFFVFGFAASEASGVEGPIVVGQSPKGDAAVDLGGAPFASAASALSQVTGLNFIIDPEVADRVIPSLRVHNMPIRSALNWICRLTGTDWTLKDEAIFITTPEKAAARSIALKVYDVRDITAAVTDFPGPEFILGVDAATGTGIGVLMTEQPAPNAIDIAELVQVITERIAALAPRAAGAAPASPPRDAVREIWACNIPGNSVQALTVRSSVLPAKRELAAKEMADFVKQNAVPAKDVSSFVVNRVGKNVGAIPLRHRGFEGNYRLVASMPGAPGEKPRLLIFLRSAAEPQPTSK